MILTDVLPVLFKRIEALQHLRPTPLLIAVDGRCAAGKSTLAALLGERLDLNVIHMDHFFLTPSQRTAERLNTPGGNVSHERFLKEVLLPLKSGGCFSYRPFDCKTNAFGDEIAFSSKRVNLVEGSYSCHPALINDYGLTIFLSIDPEEQLRRIMLRNGPKAANSFKDKWIPLEELYFNALKIRDLCDLAFDLQS